MRSGKKEVFVLDAYAVGAAAMIVGIWCAFCFAFFYENWIFWITIPFSIVMGALSGVMVTIAMLHYQTAPGDNRGYRHHSRHNRRLSE